MTYKIGDAIRLAPIEENIVRQMAEFGGPSSAAQKVLDEAAEIRARGNLARFYFDAVSQGLCVREGIPLPSSGLT